MCRSLIFIWDLFVINASNFDHLENSDSQAGLLNQVAWQENFKFLVKLSLYGFDVQVCFEYDVYSVLWWPGTENGGPGW